MVSSMQSSKRLKNIDNICEKNCKLKTACVTFGTNANIFSSRAKLRFVTLCILSRNNEKRSHDKVEYSVAIAFSVCTCVRYIHLHPFCLKYFNFWHNLVQRFFKTILCARKGLVFPRIS